MNSKHDFVFKAPVTALVSGLVMFTMMSSAQAGDVPVAVSEPSALPLLVMSAVTLLTVKFIRSRKK